MEIKTIKPYTFEQFTSIRNYGLGAMSFSPDGKDLAYTVNTSGQINLWRQSTTGGLARQLTFYSERTVRAIAWAPSHRHIAFIADLHGDEFTHIYLILAHGGQPKQLTEGPQTKYSIGGSSWSPNGRYLAFCANDRDDHANIDVMVRDMKTGGIRRVLAGNAIYDFAGWSPNSEHILAVDYKSNTNQDMILLDPRAGTHCLLTEHSGNVKYQPGPWATESAGFYFLSDESREFTGLAFYNLRDYSWQWVETPKWDVEYVAGTLDGHYLAWVVNENGYSRLYIRNLITDKLIDLPRLPEGALINLTFSPNGEKLAMMWITPTHCAEIFVLDLKKCTLTQLTQSMLGGIDESKLALPRLINYPAHDGRKIPAWLYKPRDASATKKVPVILSIHGGPEAQERPLYAYSGLYQYCISRGIGVLAPNIRGSTGYGKTYQKLIYRDWGGAELKDIEHAAKYLLAQNWVDSSRLGVFGISFGGFATLSAISRLPDYWAAAVDIFGISNLLTFVQSVPPTWRRFMDEWVGNPEADREMLVGRSPLTYVNQIKAPIFIVQGAKDVRVVKAESDQIVERLLAHGVAVRYDVYEDEGHGFTKRENEIKVWHDTAEFFEKSFHLRKASNPVECRD
jgi:dipeptidyl aminopeptidase/acylaminoacyl peptidase